MNVVEIEKKILALQAKKQIRIENAREFFGNEPTLLAVLELAELLSSIERFKHVRFFQYLDTYQDPAQIIGFSVASLVANNTYVSLAWSWMCFDVYQISEKNQGLNINSYFVPYSCANDIVFENLRRVKNISGRVHDQKARNIPQDAVLKTFLDDLVKMCAKYEVDNNKMFDDHHVNLDGKLKHFYKMLEAEKTELLAKKKSKEDELLLWLPKQKIYQESGDRIRQLYQPVGHEILQHINSLLVSPVLIEAIGPTWVICGDSAIRETTGEAYGLEIPLFSSEDLNGLTLVFEIIRDTITIRRRDRDSELTGADPVKFPRVEGRISDMKGFFKKFDEAMVDFSFKRLEAFKIEKSLPEIKYED